MDSLWDVRISFILVNISKMLSLSLLSLFKRDGTSMNKYIIDINCTSLTGVCIKKDIRLLYFMFMRIRHATWHESRGIGNPISFVVNWRLDTSSLMYMIFWSLWSVVLPHPLFRIFTQPWVIELFSLLNILLSHMKV